MSEILRPFHVPNSATQSWGSEAANIPIRGIEPRKHRYSLQATRYQDIAALQKFGIDPLRPAGGGIIMSANSHGFPIDGYTTGYTTKLPPAADFGVATRTPVSGLQPTVVGTSGPADTPAITLDEPSDAPADSWDNPYAIQQQGKQLRNKQMADDAIFASAFGAAALQRRNQFMSGAFGPAGNGPVATPPSEQQPAPAATGMGGVPYN